MGETILYQRARFTTRLPDDRRYTPSHYWIEEWPEGTWRVGFTRFASWLLGDLVECEFSIPAGSAVAVGQELGWVEGLKAIQTVYSVAEGEFLGAGDELQGDVTLLESDPYERGWLYRIRGKPAADTLDVHGYMAVLDQEIEEALRNRQEECDRPYAG
ncbi:MAG TPA: glycine cleavage system protein H [Bryobacteraceae bacterium]|nr:glycine cleavage system protein H [Bryobacteraceae bacterium]